MNESDLAGVKVGVARIEERLAALTSATSRAHSDMNAKLDKLASKETADDHESRLDSLERNQSWAVRGVIGAVIMTVLGVIGITGRWH